MANVKTKPYFSKGQSEAIPSFVICHSSLVIRYWVFAILTVFRSIPPLV
jgi:hypothetical protein